MDMARGIEVLRLSGGTSAARVSAMVSVSAPSRGDDPNAAVPVSSLERRRLVCPLFS